MKIINSISKKHRLLSLPEPLHPLVSVIRISEIRFNDSAIWKNFSVNFYCISLNRNVAGKARYGHGYFDYDKGVMTFIAPRQVMSLEESQSNILSPASGYALLIHPDFLYKHPLAETIRIVPHVTTCFLNNFIINYRHEKMIYRQIRKLAVVFNKPRFQF